MQSCRQLGYDMPCDEWEISKRAKARRQADNLLSEMDWDDLFLDGLLDGFKKQAALDRVTRHIKQNLSENGFDIDFDSAAFSDLAGRLIAVSLFRDMLRGMGLALYEERLMECYIEKNFKTKREH